jgi:hypothetical protein
MNGHANQGNSTHDHRPTNNNSKRYDCWMYNSYRGEEGPYPDNDADDTKTHPDQDFHLGSVFLIAEMLGQNRSALGQLG